MIKWLFYTKLSERRNKIANSYALYEHKVPLAKVGKEIVKEMGLEKVPEIAEALDGWGNMRGMTHSRLQRQQHRQKFRA